jgi:hypothetical protein
MGREKTATQEFLLKIMGNRSWHGIVNDESGQRAAHRDKQLLKSGGLSHEKAEFWLKKLGYFKVKHEVWEKLVK